MINPLSDNPTLSEMPPAKGGYWRGLSGFSHGCFFDTNVCWGDNKKMVEAIGICF